jgi:hypothetical protein
MNTEQEDLSASVPESMRGDGHYGSDGRPGIGASQLRRVPRGRYERNVKEGKTMLFVAIGAGALIAMNLIAVVIGEGGGPMLLMTGLLAVFGLLVFIAVMLYRIANR